MNHQLQCDVESDARAGLALSSLLRPPRLSVAITRSVAYLGGKSAGYLADDPSRSERSKIQAMTTGRLRSTTRLLHRRRPTCCVSQVSSRQYVHSISLLPPPSSLPRRIIFGSCSCQTEDLSYWDTLATQEPDIALLLGDNVYGGRNPIDLEKAYDTLGAHPSFQRACQSVPIFATLDDNDYGNGGDACSRNPYKDSAKKVFLNFFQVPKEDERWQANRGVYTSLCWGEELQILMLDLRYHKDRFLETDERGAPGKQCHVPDHSDTSKSMLGEQQWEWLENEMKKPFSLRLLASPLQVMAEGHGFECWRMFPLERERLLAMVNKSEGTTFIISGDRHAGAFYQMDELIEVTSSSLTHTVAQGLLDSELDSSRIGDFVHCNNFGMIDIDWEKGKVLLTLRRTDNGALLSGVSGRWERLNGSTIFAFL